MIRIVRFLTVLILMLAFVAPSWATGTLHGKRFAPNGLSAGTQAALVQVANVNVVADREYAKRLGDNEWKQPGAVEMVDTIVLDGKSNVYNSLEDMNHKVFEYGCRPPSGTQVYVYQSIKTGNTMPVKQNCANPLRLGQKPVAPVVAQPVQETSIESEVDVDINVHATAVADAKAEATAVAKAEASTGPINICLSMTNNIGGGRGGAGYMMMPQPWKTGWDIPILTGGFYRSPRSGDIILTNTQSQTAQGGQGGQGGAGGAGGSVGDITNTNNNVNQNSANAAANSVVAVDGSTASGSSNAGGSQKVKW